MVQVWETVANDGAGNQPQNAAAMIRGVVWQAQKNLTWKPSLSYHQQ